MAADLRFRSRKCSVRLLGSEVLSLRRSDDPDSYWAKIDQWVNNGQGFFGFVGFDCFNEYRRESPNELLASFARLEDFSTCAVAQGRGLQESPLRGQWRTSAEDENRYLEAVGRVVQMVEAPGQELERLTLARRMIAAASVDIDATFAAAHPIGCSRAVALRLPGHDLIGESPELLLTGSLSSFRTYKLSGTAGRSSSPGIDAHLLREMKASVKLSNEHQLSAKAVSRSLARLGIVSQRGPTVLELPDLRHFVSVFRTTVQVKQSIRSVLSTIAPNGASPASIGLPLLAELEPASRGPYYGLVGYVLPNGMTEFVQVIRCLFRTPEIPDWHTWVGAAIVPGSTPEMELNETRLKLRGIRFMPTAA